MIRVRVLTAVWTALCCVAACPAAAQQRFRVMEYNVENLFDCLHDSLKNDSEFLPDGIRRWSRFRYFAKLGRIAQVVWAAGDDCPPDLVGLCEVENPRCMDDLVHRSPLKEAGYAYVMTDSPDRRGIDVALLYQPSSFCCLGSQSVRIPSGTGSYRPTRDLLHVWGRVLTGDTLDVFLCHLPSKVGGARRTAPFRLLAAQTLRQVMDSVRSCRQSPNLLVMGDFNDGPFTPTVAAVSGRSKAWRAKGHDDSQEEKEMLVDLLEGKGPGTYRYKGRWERIDHLMVNSRLCSGTSAVRADTASARVLALPFLLREDDRYGGDTPFRTYWGMKYEGGYSDHLPVVADLELYVE